MRSGSNIDRCKIDKEHYEFKEVFDAYYLPLCSFADYFVHQTGAAEDIVQEAFLKLWKKFDDFPNATAARSFLYTSTRNACLDYVKHRAVAARNEERVIAASPDPRQEELLIVEEEVHARIYDAIKELSPQSRQIVLYSMEGLSNPEIAEEMGVSVNTVKTVKLRAYRTLRHKLSGLGWLLFLLLHQ